MKLFFDLDGTLIDIAKRHYKVYTETVIQLNGKPLDKNTYWSLKKRKTNWAYLLKKSKLNPSIEHEYLSKFIEKIEDPNYLRLDTLFPGVIELLETLSFTQDIYLVSLRRNEHNLLDELEGLGIKKYFKQILTGHSETDGYDKKIELVKSILETHKGVIIGDTEADIITGKQLDMKTIAVSSGIRDKEFLESLNPDYIVKNVTDIIDFSFFKNGN